MKSRLIIYADEGKVLTNGETYGTQIFLAENDKPENWHEITEEEHAKILEEQEGGINE